MPNLPPQEATLLKIAPHLIFTLNNKNSSKTSYSLLMSSDYERSSWKDMILGLQSRGLNSLPASPTGHETLPICLNYSAALQSSSFLMSLQFRHQIVMLRCSRCYANHEQRVFDYVVRFFQ